MMKNVLLASCRLLTLAAGLLLSATAGADEDMAGALMKAGEQRFRNGEYDAAIRDFEQAYRGYPIPEMWIATRFNIANSHASAGRPRQALAFLREYFAKAPADDPSHGEAEDLQRRQVARLAA